MKFFLSAPQKILDFFQPQSIGSSEEDYFRARLTNQIALVVFFASCFFIPVFYFLDQIVLSLMIFPVISLFFISMLLNKAGLANISKHLILASISFAIFLFSSILGKDSGIHLLSIVLIAIPFAIFPKSRYRSALLLTLVPIISWLSLEITNYQLFARFFTPIHSVNIVYYTACLCVVGINLGFMRYYQILNERSEEKLKRKNDDLIAKSTEIGLQRSLAVNANNALEIEKEALKAEQLKHQLTISELKSKNELNQTLINHNETLIHTQNMSLKLLERNNQDLAEKQKENQALLTKLEEEIILKNQANEEVTTKNKEITAKNEELKKLLVYQSDLMRAGELQAKLLPQTKPEEVSLIIETKAARYMSGDFWLWEYLNDAHTKIFLMVADVQGKGAAASLPSVHFAVKIRSFLENHPAKDTLTLTPIVEHVLKHVVSGDGLANKSLATVLLIIDTETNTFEILIAGMELPVFFRQNGAVVLLESFGIALGYDEDETYQTQTFSFSKGDRIMAATDGLKDAKNEASDFFGEEQLQELMSNAVSLPLQEIAPSILDPILKFQGDRQQKDDMTMMVVEF